MNAVADLPAPHAIRRVAGMRVVGTTGPAMASSATVVLTVHGKGGHGAMPQRAVAPVVAASATVMALQTIASYWLLRAKAFLV